MVSGGGLLKRSWDSVYICKLVRRVFIRIARLRALTTPNITLLARCLGPLSTPVLRAGLGGGEVLALQGIRGVARGRFVLITPAKRGGLKRAQGLGSLEGVTKSTFAQWSTRVRGQLQCSRCLRQI